MLQTYTIKITTVMRHYQQQRTEYMIQDKITSEGVLI